VKILVVLGSLRAVSSSSKLAQATKTLGNEVAVFEIINGRDLPLFNHGSCGQIDPDLSRAEFSGSCGSREV
jgi:NAD(P)H-dependent FMN reductase